MKYHFNGLFSITFIAIVLTVAFSYASASPTVLAIRPNVISKNFLINEDGKIEITADEIGKIYVFGNDEFNNITEGELFISFTKKLAVYGDDCSLSRATAAFELKRDKFGIYSNVKFTSTGVWYICLGIRKGDVTLFSHQSQNKYLSITSVNGSLLPIWLQILLIAFLLSMSGLFSGLNLGLMALDKNDLEIVRNVGSEKEKAYAKKIAPVRRKGNYLLCTLLLGNVLVNNTMTILLDDLTNGWIAVLCSTIAIVLFGEIVPQSVCTRHGLAVGAYTIWITKLFMVLTFPLSFPLSLVLNRILGEEMGAYYSRERFIAMAKLAANDARGEFDYEAVEMIRGALELKKILVKNVMTPLEDCFMLNINDDLGFELLTKISNSGFSRIPVYDGERTNVVALINVKDLTLIDPDDNTPLRTLSQFYKHTITFVFEDTTLDFMLKEFRKGLSHMAFVQKIVNEEEKDPYYQVTGIITLEDVIEEMIGAEIIDETDVITDNRTKKKIERMDKIDFSSFKQSSPEQPLISAPLKIASFQYLSTALPAFAPEKMDAQQLKRLIDINVYVEGSDTKQVTLYTRNKSCDYFIMLMEGRARVEVGSDNFQFEQGPFACFGLQVLQIPSEVDSPASSKRSSSMCVSSTSSHSFIPDFTAVTIGKVTFLKIKRSQYLNAYAESQVIISKSSMACSKSMETIENAS